MATEHVTMNPSDKNGLVVLSNGNLTVTSTDGSIGGNIRATHGKSTGKWYWEVKLDSGAVNIFIGIANKSYPITSTVYTGTTGDALNLRAYFASDGNRIPENTAYGTAWAVGNTIGVALDLDIGTLTFYKNGVSMGASHTNVKTMGEVFPFFKDATSATKTYTVNFGASEFTYPVPSGFKPYGGKLILNKILLSSSDGKVKNIIGRKYTDNLIPKMTSNTSPSGIASASSVADTSSLAWKAFSGVDGDSWITIKGQSIGWLEYKFNGKKNIAKYSFECLRGGGRQRTPKAWTFEGSDTGLFKGEQVVLDTRTDVTEWIDKIEKEFTIKNGSSYLHYRLNVTANNGDTLYSGLSSFKMYESSSNDAITQIPSQSEQNFINHGMTQSDLASADMLADFTEKHYVQDATTVLGSGKVFEHVLDVNKVLKKLKIN